MTRTEHLLCILAEECSEVSHRASKAMRFGVEEVQPGQPLTNADRIAEGLADLLAVYLMLKESGTDLWAVFGGMMSDRIERKREQVEEFLRYSAECGTLS